jgi:hypothetical protein
VLDKTEFSNGTLESRRASPVGKSTASSASKFLHHSGCLEVSFTL